MALEHGLKTDRRAEAGGVADRFDGFVVLHQKALGRLALAGRYIRLPYHGEEGHKILGNWWTTILNAHGNPIEHYGAPDVSLQLDQRGPIRPFLG